jgi:eukaryotic-like serine/threonine-protein kinase
MDTGLQLFRSKRSVAQPSSRVLVEPEYLSPERIRGNRGTATSDIYGLGVLMYELLTGKPPFTAADPAETRRLHLESEPARLPASCERLAPIVLRCLAKDPARRFPDVAEVRQALAWHAGDSSGPSTVQIRTPGGERTAERAQAPEVDPAGEVLGSYELVKLLGQGGMGRVYQARHLKLDRMVAIKLLRPELSKDPSQLQRFFQEARAVNKVNHEHIVEVADFVEETPAEGGRVYCVMELLVGRSLRDLARQDPVPLSRAINICRQVCDALEAAHQVGVVHRDIKPDNIFLIEKGGKPDFVKVLDFGVAKLKSATEADTVGFTRSGVVVGTPAYMAPEQALGESVGPGADIYALASVLYGLLMGHPPFDSTTIGVLVTRLVTQPAPPLLPKSIAGEPLPEGLRRLVERCLLKEPDQRPKSMAELSAALALFETGVEELSTARLPVATPAPARGRRRWWAWIAGVVAAVAVAG